MANAVTRPRGRPGLAQYRLLVAGSGQAQEGQGAREDHAQPQHQADGEEDAHHGQRLRAVHAMGWLQRQVRQVQ